MSGSKEIIDKIQIIRGQNNRHWMALMQLAFKYVPDEAKIIMAKIAECDAEINELTKELCK